MPTKPDLSEFAQHLAAIPRPHLNNRHSSSVPSTPFQHSRRLSFGARSPSPDRTIRNGSPKSTHSQTELGVPSRSKAPSLTGCKFETGMAFSRRRIPYSVGGDQLERAKTMPKKFLNPEEEEEKLSGDMRELYDQILPSKESDERRAAFVQKLERILNQQWPGNDIRVHVFGSSGNLLCTSDSDVDICITTPYKALERVCLLASALAEHGMQRVVCVPHAKVPIVKFWDPELQLACDMNVNNTLALENTRMIKTYVEIDKRVRPLAMIIKHWTKRRILNDAALGGTLSSYTWICMILNFLQTRNPPILPSLHIKPHLQKSSIDGKTAGFNDDIETLRGFGRANKETLGELLFQFFRRYAHDLDFEKNVVSVREGRLISKEAKRWHLMQNNRLCVEEPFNTERNLGNTADDISFRGIHLELRRAFDLVSEAKLTECLEQYVFPATEEKIWEKPPSKPPPVLSRSRSQSQSSRAHKGGYGGRGGRHGQNHHRNGRRASSAAAMNKFPIPQAGPQSAGDRHYYSRDPAVQAHFDQSMLHDHLFNELQYLQQREHELRLLQAQNQLQAQLHLQASGERSSNSPQSAREPSHRFPVSHVPLSAPLRSAQYFAPCMYPQVPGTPQQSVHTQPSSPSMKAAQPDLRRSIHRSSAADSASSSSLRSHSQPARPLPANVSMQSVHPIPLNGNNILQYQQLRQQQQHLYHALETQSRFRPVEASMYQDQRRQLVEAPFEDSVPKEYVGYWVNDSPPSHPYREDSRNVHLPNYSELHPRVRGIPPNLGRLRNSSRSPSPPQPVQFRDRSFSVQSASSVPGRQRFERVSGAAPAMRPAGPVIVNGSDNWATHEYPTTGDTSSHATTLSEATSDADDHLYETSATSEMEASSSFQSFEESFVLDNPSQYYLAHPAQDLTRITPPNRNGNHEASTRRPSNHTIDTVSSPSTVKRSDKPHKSAGGLGIQFGELEIPRLPITEVTNTQDQSRHRSAVIKGDPTTSSLPNGPTEKPPMPIPLLSPVREVRTPSPVGRRREELAGAVPPNIKRPAKMDLYIPAFSELVRAKQEKQKKANGMLSPKTNGMPSKLATNMTQASAPKMYPSAESPKSSGQQHQVNGWQQQSSKKRGKHKSRPGSGTYFLGEPLPVNDAERKGG